MPGVTTEYVFGDYQLTVLAATVLATVTVTGLLAARRLSLSPEQYARRGGLAYACVYVGLWVISSTVFSRFVTPPFTQLPVFVPVLCLGILSYGALAGSVLYLYGTQQLRTQFVVLFLSSTLWGVFRQSVGDGELAATGELYIESLVFVPVATLLVLLLATIEAWIRSDTTVALLSPKKRA